MLPLEAPTPVPIVVAKVCERRKERLVQILSVADRVQFDTRAGGWMLVVDDIGARPRKQDPRWIHDSDVAVEWIRTFIFPEQEQ